MTSKSEQKLINIWIKRYGYLTNAELAQIFKEDFEGKSTPRREDDRARMKAIQTLLA